MPPPVLSAKTEWHNFTVGIGEIPAQIGSFTVVLLEHYERNYSVLIKISCLCTVTVHRLKPNFDSIAHFDDHLGMISH